MLGAQWAIRWVEYTAQMVAEKRIELIELDREIGDGDHGENLDRGFSAVVKKLAEAREAGSVNTVGDVAKIVAITLTSTVGGAAGPLYGTAYLRAVKAGASDLDSAGVVEFLRAALEGIKARGKATVGEKTMVDAWSPAVEAAEGAAASGASPAEVLRAAAAGAQAGAVATEPLVATKGRASYLGQRAVGHRDPGAQSSAYILECAARAAAELS